MPETRSWDGAAYDRLSTPMEAMGREVMERLELRGDETVLDAGCGSGRLTEVLRERLPDGRVIGVDVSASMIEAARKRLGPDADLRVGDLVGLDLGGETVDAVFSTATFHWIADHDALFASLRGVLRPGGRLVAQCGGAGNIASVHAAARQAADDPPFRSSFEGWSGPWNFATPEDTERRLHAAGFAEARCWLAERPVQPDDPREYLRTINLGAHLERLPAELQYPFVDAVLARLGERPVLDYVRLNIDAVAAS
jgi:trans-aconitate 2-methyltransferase